jgi:hypothetical protein
MEQAVSAEARDPVVAVELRELKAQGAKFEGFIEEMRLFMSEQRAYSAVRSAEASRFMGSDWPEMKHRVGKIEDRVLALESFRWRILGAIAAAGAISGVIGAVAGVIASVLAA